MIIDFSLNCVNNLCEKNIANIWIKMKLSEPTHFCDGSAENYTILQGCPFYDIKFKFEVS